MIWYPPVYYEDDYTYDGSKSSFYNGTNRPQSHLTEIRNRAPEWAKHPDTTVLNLFFVEIVPGFTHLPDNAANGLAFLDANGAAIHVGSDLLLFQAGRNAVASVVAHEIGHCLGLAHNKSSSNLMHAGGATAAYLEANQESAIFSNNSGVDGYDMIKVATPYDLWAGDRGVGMPSEDDDGDRLSNLFEFMFGSNPKGFTNFPAAQVTPGGPTWTFARQADAVAAGYRYRVRTGPDLGALVDAGTPGSGSTIVADESEVLSVRLDTAAGRRGFLTVDVEQAAAEAAEEPMVAAMAGEEPQGEPQYSDCDHAGCMHVLHVELPDEARRPDGTGKR